MPPLSDMTCICCAALLMLCAAQPAAAQPAGIDGARLAANPAGSTAARASAAPALPMVAQVEFNASFLSPAARQGIDVTRFEKGNPVLPGDYRVGLYLNGRAMGSANVTVKPGSDPYRGQVCMTRALLEQVGLDWSRLPEPAVKALAPEGACAALEELVDGAHATLDTGELRLDLALPQIALRRTPRGYVSPDLWDAGVTGGMLGYALNAYRNNKGSAASNAAYLNLNAGFNLGDWRLRHNSAANRQSGSASTYQSIDTYAERDISAITGRVTIGEGNTTGRVFDTQSFRGVQLASDDRMLPDSQRGYAPVIHGVAQTNARVTIRQHDVVIYDTPVPPGPFVIDDLYPTGYGGNLDVTVTEGDGRVNTFSVPYASVAQLLRPDASRYSLTAGVLRNRGLHSTPKFLEATYQRGLSNWWTGYGGVQASDRYAAMLGGVALGTPAGALALDVTGARTQLPSGGSGGGNRSGVSVRAGYSKLFEQTGSNVAIAAYRYSTSGFFELADAARTIDAMRHGLPGNAMARPRSRLSLTLNQSLGGRRGQLYLSGYAQHYWNGRSRDVQYQLGYSNQYRALTYSISATRMRSFGGGADNRIMLNLSMPLGSSRHAPHLGANVTRQSGGGSAVQTTLTGLAGEDNQWTYGVAASRDSGSGRTAGTVNGQYTGSRATVKAGYGVGSGYSNISAGLSGSIVAHPGGVTLSPYPSETVAVVAAPDAAGARVLGYPGVRLDASGHAVLPYLTPYRVNEVTIDPKGISPDVELKTTSQQVAPRAGSIAMLRYATASGRAVLIDAALPGGEVLPFGAEVTDGQGNVVGAVGQAGRIYARLPAADALLSVRWGQTQGQQCAMRVALPPAPQRRAAADGIERLQLSCTPDAAAPDRALHQFNGESVK